MADDTDPRIAGRLGAMIAGVVVVLAYILIRTVLNPIGPDFSEMTADDVLLAGVIMLAIVFIRYSILLPFELYRLCVFIHVQQPEEWAALGAHRSAMRRIASLIFGYAKLDIPDRRCSRRLSYIRWSLCLFPLLILVSLGMIGWAAAQW
jgi:hypothetical protein